MNATYIGCMPLSLPAELSIRVCFEEPKIYKFTLMNNNGVILIEWNNTHFIDILILTVTLNLNLFTLGTALGDINPENR